MQCSKEEFKNQLTKLPKNEKECLKAVVNIVKAQKEITKNLEKTIKE